MSFEHSGELIRAAQPEEFSLDANKFERTLILDRLSEMSSRICSEKEIDSQDAFEILDVMDKLAAIGYFTSSDSENNWSAEDWEQRGINTKKQFDLEADLMNKGMLTFETLLENIYAAEAKPAGFIKMIYEKAKKQSEDNISGARKVILFLRHLDTHYLQE